MTVMQDISSLQIFGLPEHTDTHTLCPLKHLVPLPVLFSLTFAIPKQHFRIERVRFNNIQLH